MPATTSLTITRASTAAAVGFAIAAVVPASAQAWSIGDLFKKPSGSSTTTVHDVVTPITDAVEPVKDAVEPVTDAATETVEAVTDAVADAADLDENAPACPESDVSKAFAKFGDDADYALAPGGDFEVGSGWKLSGGAKVVSGNESLGVSPGSRSLKLPLGAVAVSPEFCVDETNPHFRFASKPDNAIAGYEAIVLYKNTDGQVKQAQFTSSASQSWGSGKWAPSSASPLATKIPLLAGGKTATVQIMFVSTGNKIAVGIGLWGRFAAGSIGTVSIDSVMVDPYRRG